MHLRHKKPSGMEVAPAASQDYPETMVDVGDGHIGI